jgi:hypothetical protein
MFTQKMLAVVVSDVEIDGQYQFERRMESTAQYWKPVWEALERYWKPISEKREGARRKSGTLHLAQA